MKKLIYYIGIFLFITTCTISCNSDDDKIIPDSEIVTVDFEFNLLIQVSDYSGNTLITTSGELTDEYYGKRNIIVRDASTNEELSFSVSESENNKPTLSVAIKGAVPENNPVYNLAIQWGETPRASVDYLTLKLEKTDDKIICKKIWVNNDLKWEETYSEAPFLFLIKEKADYVYPKAKPIVLKHPQKAQADNLFAFNLFKKTVLEASKKKQSNAFISPLSVNMALSMLVNGAEGKTKEEISTALESKNYPVSIINEHQSQLRKELTTIDPTSSILISNSLWNNIDFSVKSTFIEANKTFYDAEVNTIDFSSQNALPLINQWCAEKTYYKIPHALEELSEETQLLLINALYFRSNWAEGYEFHEEGTQEEPFYAANGSSNQVKMMHMINHYKYGSNSNAKYLSIPFGNQAYNMTFMLPNKNKSIQDVIDHIEKESLWTTSTNMSYKKTRLSVPKFKLDFSYEMHEFILPEMGMKIPFIPNQADFTGISTTPTLVSRVIHKTFIDVNENGAEAAAITIIGQLGSNGTEEPEEIIDFKLNQPFVFAICEESTGTILFLGMIEKL